MITSSPQLQQTCRLCGSSDLISVIDLGHQYLTGVFPSSLSQTITGGPLQLSWSETSKLLQLSHNYDLNELYGDNYGYRSGLNGSMVNHLQKKVKYLELFVNLQHNETVLDIGSNDGTTLNSYSNNPINRIGFDPTIKKFGEFYNKNIKKIPCFFDKEKYFENTDQKSKIVTSLSMLYDLPNPAAFARDVKNVLADDGLWHFEQSYLPAMLNTLSYDTICHEHIEYYSLSNIVYLLEQAELKLIDVSFNDINGGSFAVTASHASSKYENNCMLIDWLLLQEEKKGINRVETYINFMDNIKDHRSTLNSLLQTLKSSGKSIAGYGASTKGNVLLQYCNIDATILDFIVEVNSSKFGCYTPGSLIPIVSEEILLKSKPDYLLVMPWHFRNFIIQKEVHLLNEGTKLIFPFPQVEIV